MPGPLAGVRVIELNGLGAGPFAAMMLCDLGAEVLLVDRAPNGGGPQRSRDLYFQHRGRKSVSIDLKDPAGANLLLQLAKAADALIDPFRPGVTERLGIGPDEALASNPKLVYARSTGWGQDGPLADRAGHDINYIALSGALHHIRKTSDEQPLPPFGLLNFGDGGMLLAVGILAGIVEASKSGQGQVIDASNVDGALLISMSHFADAAAGSIRNSDEDNAHYWQAYETSDGKYVSIGAREPKFYEELLDAMGLSLDEMPQDRRPEAWPELKAKFAAIFRTKTRDQWCEILEDRDTCFAPVLTPKEAPEHRHFQARNAFIEVAGHLQPAPAPRFSRTKPEIPTPPPAAGADTIAALGDWGIDEDQIISLLEQGTVVRGEAKA